MKNFLLPKHERLHVIRAIAEYLRECHDGREVKVSVSLHKGRRSDAQNRALWGVAYKVLSDATGNDKDDLHTYFLGEWGGWDVVDVMGSKRRVPVKRSSRLAPDEFREYYEFIQRRAAEAGYYVPDPGEYL